MKRVLGIFRATCYSPGMAERDEAILRAVATRLEAMNHAVNLIHEEDFAPDTPMPDIVLHMTRSPRALEILQGWEEAGCRVINPARSIHGVERAALARLCATHHIPTPKTWIVSTSEPRPEAITLPCWVKRTGTCAQEPGDVCLVSDAEDYRQCLARFHARGIEEVAVMEHEEGPCIKFYAVRGADFFHCLPAYDKWSDITLHTSSTTEHTDEAEAIKQDIIRKIETIGSLPMIYGGDAIISSDGTARLIDLNDWPSFSACREEAAEAISQLVMGG